MSPTSTVALEPGADTREAASAALPRIRPFYWSLRRELWENRSVYLAPVGVGTFAVTALVVHAVTMPSHGRAMLGNDPAHPGGAAVTYTFAATLLLATAFIVGAFYSLEALSGERRDRSILFWKSLPVPDRATVLAKASIPLAVLPLLTFVVIVAAQLALLLLGTLVLLVQGESAAPLWSEVQPLRRWPGLLYAVAVMVPWHAPIYGFLLLVSGWARRTAVLWAVLPLLAAGALEYLTMDTTFVAWLVRHRLLGWYGQAFADPARGGMTFDMLAPLTPGRFLGTPGLWMGLALAALFVAAAVRLRRSQEPA